MSIADILDMAATAVPDRIALTCDGLSLRYDRLRELASLWGRTVARSGASHVVYVGVNHPAFAVALFAAAKAGVPAMPINFRLADQQITAALAELQRPYILADGESGRKLAARGFEIHPADSWTSAPASEASPEEATADPDAIAVLLQTSGTTSAPKSAILRHTHLTSYIFGSLDFASTEDTEAALVSVPPYHVAGVTNLLSNIYTARRVVYLNQFNASDWLSTVRDQSITHAMLVPTMLSRIVDELATLSDRRLPSLRSIAYGGAAIARPVLEKALALLPDVDFVNAYGLTETSSTIAVLGPDDHRQAFASHDPHVSARLSSAGRPLPDLEIKIRDDAGSSVPAGTSGQLWVRGPQVAGEYVGRASMTDSDGWFYTRDRARLDVDGYLFIEGRQDDTIIRGGENIAPAEIEDVLLQHPDVSEVAVVGVADDEWGQRIAAAVLARDGRSPDPEELKRFVRSMLRSSRTPDVIEVWRELPYTETGKLLRRKVAEIFSSGQGAYP